MASKRPAGSHGVDAPGVPWLWIAFDIGCGRGAVTVQLAKRRPRGSVAGIDLWCRRMWWSGPWMSPRILAATVSQT